MPPRGPQSPFGPARKGGPAVNLPPVCLGLILVNLAVHLVRLALPAGLDDDLVHALAVVPARYGEADSGFAQLLLAPFSYQFLHADWLHIGMNLAALAAFGAPVERMLGARLFLVFYLLCGALAAAGFVAVHPGSEIAMVGASGGVSGLFGAALMVLRASGLGAVAPMALFWIGLQLFTGFFGAGPEGGGIAWEAHIAGFLAGLALIRPFSRGRI